jgi:hypothetical protein
LPGTFGYAPVGWGPGDLRHRFRLDRFLDSIRLVDTGQLLFSTRWGVALAISSSIGWVIIIDAGTGSPFFTTDTGAARRASEPSCDAVMKATHIDGIYTADPKKDPTAKH